MALLVGDRSALTLGNKLAVCRATIFYSWQSDTPAEVNRTYIRSCLADC